MNFDRERGQAAAPRPREVGNAYGNDRKESCLSPFSTALKVADAVLYEGYLLYPYRPSSRKNQFRWQFGVVAPKSWDGDPCFTQTECLIEPQGSPVIEVMVRFLQVQPKTGNWDEGIERVIEINGITSGEQRFEFAPVVGVVRVSAEQAGQFIKLRVRIENLSEANPADRNEAMRHSLAGTHTLLRVTGGSFLSALDATNCENLHAWPVLIGRERQVMLSAPIILEDYPAIAPESKGDFFDGTEIDEMLTLRVMTMTDKEKREAAAADDRARRIIERCDNLPQPDFEKLHGTIRSMGEDFFNPASERPESQSVEVSGGAVARGSRVRIAPRRSADAMDLFLKGRTARVESVHRDLENRAYVAVSIEDDPGADIRKRFYYFFPDELEFIEKENGKCALSDGQ